MLATQWIQGYFVELVDQEPRVVSDVAHSMLQWYRGQWIMDHSKGTLVRCLPNLPMT